MPFDLLIRGGTLVDGTGVPGHPADGSVTGDRVAAAGNLATVDAASVPDVIDAAGRVVAFRAGHEAGRGPVLGPSEAPSTREQAADTAHHLEDALDAGAFGLSSGLGIAIAKLTCVPAAQLGLADEVIVRDGAFADLVVLDPATIADRATFAAPAVHPAGIAAVIVNGVVAMRDGAETGARPGRLLRRS